MADHKGHQRGVPILVVITVATFLSTAASLGGGLMMYLEGLASLQESVRTTSASEVDQLRVATLATFDRTATYGKAMRTFLWSTERLPPGSTMDDAVSLSRSLFHAEVMNSGMLYYISYALIPDTDYISRNTTYAVVWGDVRRTGEREMMFGEYGPHLPDSARVQNADNPLAYDMLLAQGYRLNDTTGELGHFMYPWDISFAIKVLAERFDNIGENGVPVDDTEARMWLSDRTDGGDVGVWAGPRRFPASDGFISAYMTLQLMLKPPPPPHPWSAYKNFVLYVGFLEQVLSDAFVQQKALQPDMEAMLAERSPKGSYVYASTLGLDIVPPRCQGANLSESFGLYLKDGCHLQVANMPAALRDAYTYLADKQAGEMYLANVGGSEHFVRRQPVIHDWEIVWIKTTSSVESEVQGALRLLILFTALVLLFDIMIAVSEVYFIGLPLAAVARTVEQIGQMRTSVASTMLHTLQQRRVMLREMCTVVDGLVWAVQQLDEYRTFMPSAVFHGHRDDSHTSDEETIREGNMLSDSSSSTSRSTSQARVAQNTSLALHVVSRNVGLLLVNCVGWSQTPDYRDASRLVASHEALVGYVISVCTSWAGVLQSFSGDRILMAWNAGNRCSDLAVRMGSSAVALVQTSTLKLSSAFSIGQAFCGTMGTTTLRRFSIVSDVLPWVHLMEGLNKMRGWRSTTDHAVAERLEGRVSYRVGDGLCVPRKRKILAVVEVLQVLENKDGEEWMYQLEASTEDGKAANEAVLHVIHQRWDAVKVLPVLPPCLEHITAAHADRRFVPMTQSYHRDVDVADEGKPHN